MWGRWARAYAARFRRNWPTSVAVAVFFVASEILDDENGEKSVAAFVVSGVVALAVLLLVRWLRDDPPAGAEHEP